MFDKYIKFLEDEINRLERRKNYLLSLDDEKKCAIVLHDHFCTSGYSCNWNSEIVNEEHDWSRPEHQEFLGKAKKVLKLFGDLDKVISAIENYKKLRQIASHTRWD